MNPYDKEFLDYSVTFFQKPPLYKFFRVNYGEEFQIRAQLMTDTAFNKKEPHEIILWYLI